MGATTLPPERAWGVEGRRVGGGRGRARRREESANAGRAEVGEEEVEGREGMEAVAEEEEGGREGVEGVVGERWNVCRCARVRVERMWICTAPVEVCNTQNKQTNKSISSSLSLEKRI